MSRSRNARKIQQGTPETRSRPYRGRGRFRYVTVSDGEGSAGVMVGTVRGPEHLEVIRRLRFYHVPVSAIAPSRTDVAYIAFYEGACQFHRETGSIRECAPVLRVSRVRRAELPGLTWPGRGGPETMYYRFDLGPIETLPRPITNPERLRIAFRFPGLDWFRRAETLKELGQATGGRERPRPRKREQR
jgi:hypothetical protein